MSSATLDCALAGRCGGCPDHARSLAAQRADKLAALKALLSTELSADIVTPAGAGFREHLDLRWDGARLGLIGVGGVVDMAICPLVVPALNAWLALIRARPLPIARASLRLRAAGGSCGIWIDCAHTDVKALLDQATWLIEVVALPDTIVELGPKARRVRIEDGKPVLREPTLEAWSTTFSGQRALPLYTTVRAFSQPGAVPNRVLVETALAAVLVTGARRVLELGAGAGNLTLPLLAAGLHVRALELDVAGLLRSARESRLDGQLLALAESFEGGDATVHDVDLVLADPPRGGLGRFIDRLARLSPGLRPEHLVYVSCHPEALARDAARLATLGYTLTALHGIDQFPWTPHAEWVATLSGGHEGRPYRTDT